MDLKQRFSRLTGPQRSLLASRVAARSYPAESLPGAGWLIAYVELEQDAGDTAMEALRRFLEERLPRYMLPSQIVPVERMPWTPSGKLDVPALPAPDGSRPQVETRFEPPQSQAERQVAGIWRDLLELDEIGVNDNFFDLGGHSLLMIRLQDRLARELGAEISIIDLFRYSTVRSQAEFLSRGAVESSSRPAKTALARQRAEKQRQAFARQDPLRISEEDPEVNHE